MTKNSKKGFTLVELVVVIAILAILAAIAIPVVNSIINTASRNGALSNAETIELAIKEAQADITARNNEVYDGTTQCINAAGTPVQLAKASTDSATPITVEMVAGAKGINDAFKPVTYNGAVFQPYWDPDTDKCVYLCTTASGTAIVSNSNLASDTLTAGYPNAGNCVALSANEAAVTTAVNTL